MPLLAQCPPFPLRGEAKATGYYRICSSTTFPLPHFSPGTLVSLPILRCDRCTHSPLRTCAVAAPSAWNALPYGVCRPAPHHLIRVFSQMSFLWTHNYSTKPGVLSFQGACSCCVTSRSSSPTGKYPLGPSL